MKVFTSISAAAAAAVLAASFAAINPAESNQSYYSTCTIKRISTGKVTYKKCNTIGARMLDGSHQVTEIELSNGNTYRKDGRMWDYRGPDCLGSRDYIICR